MEVVLPGHALYEPQLAGDHPVGPGPINAAGQEHSDLHTATSTPSYAALSSAATASELTPARACEAGSLSLVFLEALAARDAKAPTKKERFSRAQPCLPTRTGTFKRMAPEPLLC